MEDSLTSVGCVVERTVEAGPESKLSSKVLRESKSVLRPWSGWWSSASASVAAVEDVNGPGLSRVRAASCVYNAAIVLFRASMSAVSLAVCVSVMAIREVTAIFAMISKALVRSWLSDELHPLVLHT